MMVEDNNLLLFTCGGFLPASASLAGVDVLASVTEPAFSFEVVLAHLSTPSVTAWSSVEESTIGATITSPFQKIFADILFRHKKLICYTRYCCVSKCLTKHRLHIRSISLIRKHVEYMNGRGGVLITKTTFYLKAFLDCFKAHGPTN